MQYQRHGDKTDVSRGTDCQPCLFIPESHIRQTKTCWGGSPFAILIFQICSFFKLSIWQIVSACAKIEEERKGRLNKEGNGLK